MALRHAQRDPQGNVYDSMHKAPPVAFLVRRDAKRPGHVVVRPVAFKAFAERLMPRDLLSEVSLHEYRVVPFVCTKLEHGSQNVRQRMFKCTTHGGGDEEVICEQCRWICHATCDIEPVEERMAVCSCHHHKLKRRPGTAGMPPRLAGSAVGRPANQQFARHAAVHDTAVAVLRELRAQLASLKRAEASDVRRRRLRDEISRLYEATDTDKDGTVTLEEARNVWLQERYGYDAFYVRLLARRTQAAKRTGSTRASLVLPRRTTSHEWVEAVLPTCLGPNHDQETEQVERRVVELWFVWKLY